VADYRTREKIVSYSSTEIEIQGKWFSLSEVLDVMEGLEGTDNFGARIVIDNHELGPALEAEGAAFKNARGSYYRHKRWEELNKKWWEVAHEPSTRVEFQVEVEQGSILVDDLRVIRKGEGVYYLRAHSHEKYPEVETYLLDNGSWAVRFSRVDRTIGMSDREEFSCGVPTVVLFTGLENDGEDCSDPHWDVHVEMGGDGFEWNFFLFKTGEGEKPLYTRDLV
jgi:hypothetical protein